MTNRTLPVVALLLSAATAFAQDAGQADIFQGEQTYMRYCATCHGIDAEGRGPMSAVLTVPPTDLTRLSAGNAGVFPTVRVVRRIDGGDPLVSHGSPMPLYGQFFEGRGVALRAADGQPIMTSQPIVDLVAWIESRQQP